MSIKFRLLKASEIDCRVSTVSDKGCSLLLYKDARVDQRILDETFGIFGWQREHQIIGDNLYCTVSVRNPDTGEWIKKQDVGTESYTEKEKGQASDSFKRSCFNLGIGRSLYSSPFIWIKKGDCKIEEKNGKWTTYDRFEVKEIGYDKEENINHLVIYNTKTKSKVFTWDSQSADEIEEEKQTEAKKITEEGIKKLLLRLSDTDITAESVCKKYGIKELGDINEEQYLQLLKDISEAAGKKNDRKDK